MDDHVWVRSADAAKIRDVNPRTVRKWIGDGKITAQRINNQWIVQVSREELEESGVNPDDVVIEPEPEPESEPPPDPVPEPTKPEPPSPGALVGPPVPDPAPSAVQVPVAPSVDLSGLVDLVTDLTRQNRDLAATTAMWQERARALSERNERLENELRALPAGPLPDPEPAIDTRPWWKRLFDIP